MASWEQIAGGQNANYKQWRRWAAHPEDPDCPFLLIEGLIHVRDAARIRPPSVLIAARSRRRGLEGEALPATRRVVLPDRLLESLSPLRSPPGVAAFFPKPAWRESDLTDCVLYVDGVSDPGNLGTLVRSAAATGRFSVVTAPGSVSCFNAKVVRATASALFRVPVLESLPLDGLLDRGYAGWVAAAEGAESLFEVSFSAPLAVVVGHETGGVGSDCSGCRTVRIPMHPGSDSLNVGIAGSLLLFEVYRQCEIRAGAD